MVMENPDHLSPSQLWMLALSAVLTEQNEYRHDILYGTQKALRETKTRKQVLQRDWGIGSTDDLRTTLNQLVTESHSHEFAAIRSYFSTLSDAGQDALIGSIPRDTEEWMQYQILKLYHHKLPAAGILAWDAGRYVYLCRSGASIGLITDGEAWRLMGEVAALVQPAYSGWEEFGMAYLAGRQFWLAELSKERVDEHVDMVRNLLLDSNSPWLKLNWHTELT